MELKMYLGNDLIDSIPVHFNKIALPGYLGHLKRELEEKNHQIILTSSLDPEFLIDTLFSEENVKAK
ncbi:MAG TPA: hypothetical protein VGC75_06840 [Candidatus Nitrosocosmicus sp.]|jgi:hypothetical protein